MEFTWSTFFLEIVNFLVLVWILAHFLYTPVMDAIARRRAAIEKTVAESEAVKRNAVALQDQFERRLSDWEDERDKARAQLREEFQAERARQAEALRVTLEQEREKAEVLEERRLSHLRSHLEETVLQQGTEFLSRLLSRLASPELEQRLVDLALDDLGDLPPERRQTLAASLAGAETPITVTTAYPLDARRRERLAKSLRSLAGRPVACRWQEDATVLAGVRISIGPWLLGASLQDELRYFAEVAHDRA